MKAFKLYLLKFEIDNAYKARSEQDIIKFTHVSSMVTVASSASVKSANTPL